MASTCRNLRAEIAAISRRPLVLQLCAVDFTAYHLLRPLLEACRQAGWNTDFACTDGPFAARLRAAGFRHHSIPIPRRASPLRIAFAIARLTAILRRERFDLIHTHTPAGGIVGRAAAALAGPALVVHTFHGLPFAGTPTGLVERSYLWLERALARRTDLFLSQSQGDIARAQALGIAREGTVPIGNGVDLRRFAPDTNVRERIRQELGVPPEAILTVFVGRMVREKGILDLADAALGLRDDHRAWFLVVGAALESDRAGVSVELHAHPAARALGPRWRPLGHREDVADLLRAADIFCLPSYREGLPRSVIEAMASGLAIVASDIPACRELLADETGVLVPTRDTGALVSALRALVADPQRRAVLGARARERAMTRHDERAIVALQVSELRKLLERRA